MVTCSSLNKAGKVVAHLPEHNVISTLEGLERILREVRQLDPNLIDSLAVRAGVLSSDVLEAESKLTGCIEYIHESMVDVDETPKLNIKDSYDHFTAVEDELSFISTLDEAKQIRLIKQALGTSDCFDNNLEGFNSMLKAMGKPWTVRHNEDEE